jgi:predicted nucleic acid-binding protein
VLVDTSVWIDHLRRRNADLSRRLEAMQVWTHDFVIGELSCGNLSRRRDVLASLAALPRSPLIEHEIVQTFVTDMRLMGRGLGWVDVHLLASAIASDLPLWTLDKRLASVASEFGLAP